MRAESKPSSFVSKFNMILQNKQFEEIIKWDHENGKIYIFDKEKLEFEILPIFFRHNKLTSFIRQLNLYGFKKIKNASFLCYTHPQLLNGQKILSIISKKNAKRSQLEESQSDQGPIDFQQKHQPENYNHKSGNQSSTVTAVQGQGIDTLAPTNGHYYPQLMLPPANWMPYGGWWNMPNPSPFPVPRMYPPLYFNALNQPGPQ